MPSSMPALALQFDLTFLFDGGIMRIGPAHSMLWGLTPESAVSSPKERKDFDAFEELLRRTPITASTI